MVIRNQIRIEINKWLHLTADYHTDPIREYAYDRKSHVGNLNKALDQAADNGWIIVDMKKDWNKVFPPK